MHRDNPASRTLLGISAAAIFLPLLLFLCANDYIGLPAYFGHGARGPLWAGVVIAGAVVAAIFGLLRSANVVRAGWLLAAAFWGPQFFSPGPVDRQLPARLVIENTHGISDVEVHCNGVALGKTPLVINEADFERLVPVWDEPPPQPHVNWSHEMDGKPALDGFCQWYWSPYSPFQDLRNHSGRDDLWMHRADTFMPGMAKQKYWWHFEQDGFVGLRSTFGWGGSGGGSRIMTFHTSLNSVEFPAVPRVVELLLQGLRDADYRPTPEWTAYVLRHRRLLYARLASSPPDGSRIEPVLDHLTRTHFDLPAEPSAADARRTLARIFDEAPVHGTFGRSEVPSVETRALSWVAPLAPGFLVEEFHTQYPELISVLRFGDSPTGDPESPAVGRREARRALLFDALEFVQPPELFVPLVFLYAQRNPEGRNPGGQLLKIIARYRTPEAVALVRQYLGCDQKSGEPLSTFASLDIPGLEDEFRDYISRHYSAGQFPLHRPAVDFFGPRIRRGRDLPQLAEWVYHARFLTSGQKLTVLSQIDDPKGAECLARLCDELNDDERLEAVKWLAQHPESRTGPFLLNSIDRQRRDNAGAPNPVIAQALLATDSPEIRQFLVQAARGEPRAWSDLLTNSVQGPLPHLDWLVPVLAEFEDYYSRRHVTLDLLAAIGTPAATALRRKWLEERRLVKDAYAVKWAEQMLVKMDREEAERARRPGELADLLAGRITPQDLIVLKPCLWREGKYEPQ